VTVVCIAGSVFATAAYFVMNPERQQRAGTAAGEAEPHQEPHL
jgi:hypothetical protein